MIFAVSNAMMPSPSDRQPWLLAGLYVAAVWSWLLGGLFGLCRRGVDNVPGALQVLTLAFLFTLAVNVVIAAVLLVIGSCCGSPSASSSIT